MALNLNKMSIAELTKLISDAQASGQKTRGRRKGAQIGPR